MQSSNSVKSQEVETVDFYGCKFLDFSDRYVATKNLISSSGITKVVWVRRTAEMCQFCVKRGRINNPRGCLDEEMKGCSDYEDFEHSVLLSSIDVI